MIDAIRLTKTFGPIAAVTDVSFHIAQGEIVGFLGPNGAGKTTTMRMLTGFAPPTSGQAVVAGFDVAKHPLEVKRRVGYLPESVPLYPEMLVRSFLGYVAAVKGVPRGRVRAEVGRVMERCGLDGMGRRTVRNLSKGYRQRVGLAQALIGSPPVLILDEPTVGLDPAQIIEIRGVIRELAADHTVLLSTHILPEVSMLCQRAIIISGGRVVVESDLATLAREHEEALLVRAKGGAEAVAAALGGVPGVTAVEPREGGVVAVTDGSEGVRERMAKALMDQGLGLESMTEHRRTLEEAFLAAISAPAGAAGPDEPAAAPAESAAAPGGMA